MHVINSLFPIFLLIGLGAFLRARKFMPDEFFVGMTKLTFWVGLPALLFYKIAVANFDFQASKNMFVSMILATIATMALSYPVAWCLKVPKQSVGTFVQCAFRSNTAFVGLPVILYVFSGVQAEVMGRNATLALAPMIPLVNVFSLIVLHKRGAVSGGVVKYFLKQCFTNPLIVACALGIVWALLGIPLPALIGRGLGALGGMALPLALISLGASLTLNKIKGNLKLTLVASVLNVAILPLLGYFIANAMGMSENERLVTLIFLACPAASSSYVMALQMGGDHTLASSVVIVSTLISAASLWLVLALG